MRALVIDDSRTVRLVIGNYLRDVGLEVVEAADGQQGLEQLRHHSDVDLVLVDWNMPVMDGLSFIQAVRAERQFDPVRIMMVTTEAEQAQVVRALEAGANEYLMKPFTRDVLVAKLGLLGLSRE
jgi:two-component system, chemotaxis family, chemotaxis protein CheY